jgi:hypothetical protein
VIARVLQIFFATALFASVHAETAPLKTGEIYRLVFTDVDRNQLSTADGHATIITVTTRQEEAKARALGDRVPDAYIGDARYRFVTVINFQGKIHSPFRALTVALVRRRLNQEAKRIQPRYSAARRTRDPRRDLFAVADFDGTAVSQLGIPSSSAGFAAFLFDGEGRLLRRWNDVPDQSELANVLAAAAAKPRS